ncbi:hypothetical protein V6N13_120696 [Hibiscus sabdariffa]|uniref:Uncharacterized protein n=1 Tax=Hibiscus sabdariffa TaxID=183260 RepID=A0ABR2E516_9ROSI
MCWIRREKVGNGFMFYDGMFRIKKIIDGPKPPTRKSCLVVVAAAMIAWRQGEPVIGTYRRGINPHAVRRAPRVPVLYSYRRDGIERVLQRGSSPQFSQKPYNKVECRKSTPVQSYDCMIQSDITKAKLQVLPLNTG